MKKKFSVAFILLVLISSFLFAEKMVVRITNPSTHDFDLMSEQNRDIALYIPGKLLDIVIDVRDFNAFQQKYPGLKVTQTEAQVKSNLHSGTKTTPGYRSYDVLVAELEQLSLANPTICQMIDLGASTAAAYYEAGYPNYANFNHHLYAIKLSDNVTEEEDEPNFYFFGTHHAREPLGVEVSMYILNYLISHYQTDPQIADIVNTSQVWFVPLVNPDGHRITTEDELDVWWRKNLRDNNNNHQFDTSDYYGYGDDGIDLNRNYGWGWGLFRASNDIGSVIYHGETPFSEVETQIIKNLIDSRHYVAGISYHTYGGMVLYPWGGEPNIMAPDVASLSQLAEDMAMTIQKTDGNGHYAPMPSWELYPASGGLDDYAYGTHGTFGYTIEMAEEFIPGQAIVQQTCQNNLQAALILLKRVQNATLTGFVKDNQNNPLKARIIIDSLDFSGNAKDFFTSDSTFGRYYRLLEPGNYQVRVEKNGYETFTSSVIITDDGQTVLNVTLNPAQPAVLSGIVRDDSDNPIENCRLAIQTDPEIVVMTDANGYYSFGGVSSGLQRICVTKPGMDLVQKSINLLPGNNTKNFTLATPTIIDDFDSGTLQWITVGQWGFSTQQHYSGNRSLADTPNGSYQPGQESSCQFPTPLSLMNITNAGVSFMAKYQIGFSDEYINFEIKVDDEPWQALDVFYGEVNNWAPYSYNLNAYLGHQVQFRFYMLTSYESSGEGIFIDDFKVFVQSEETANDEINAPLPSTQLIGNFPNPFNPLTFIYFNIAEPGLVTIDIFNIKGQKVKTFSENYVQTGKHKLLWDGRDNQKKAVSSGVYFYRMKTARVTSTMKMLLVK